MFDKKIGLALPKTFSVYDKDNTLVHSEPYDYELGHHVVKGGSFFGAIKKIFPVVGMISKVITGSGVHHYPDGTLIANGHAYYRPLHHTAKMINEVHKHCGMPHKLHHYKMKLHQGGELHDELETKLPLTPYEMKHMTKLMNSMSHDNNNKTLGKGVGYGSSNETIKYHDLQNVGSIE